jgi:trimethylamine--corrinoid protein Co-methyltransferase
VLPLPKLGTQVAQFIYDFEAQEARPGTVDDFQRVVQVGDALHGDEGVGHALTVSGVSPFVEPMEAGLILARNARNPDPPFAWNVRQIPYLRRMGEALGRQNWFALGALCIAHPFRFDRDVAEKLYFRAKNGYSTGLTAMPVAGITTPVTREGFAVVSAAEILACWIVARAVNARTPLHADLWPGTADLASGETSYSTPDSLAYGFATSDLILRMTGIHVPVGGAEYTDAKRPGYLALYEKAVKGLEIARHRGIHPMLGEGMLDKGKTLCLEQLLLEREYTQAIRYVDAHQPVSAEAMGIDAVRSVGFGSRTTHLETAHTIEFMRDSLWRPTLLDRTGAFDDERALERAHRQAEALRKSHVPPALPTEVERELATAAAEAKAATGAA